MRVLFWKHHLAGLQTRVDEPVVQQETWKRPGVRRAAVGMRRNIVKGYLGCKLDYGVLVRKRGVAQIHLTFRTGQMAVPITQIRTMGKGHCGREMTVGIKRFEGVAKVCLCSQL